MSLHDVQSHRLAPVLELFSDQLDILGHTLTLQSSREHAIAAAQVNAEQIKLKADCQYNSQQVSKQRLELEEKLGFTFLLQLVEEEKQKKAAKQRGREKRELQQRRQTQMRQQEEFQQKTEKFQGMCHHVKEWSRQMEEEASQIAGMKIRAEKRTEKQLQMNPDQNQREDQLELLDAQLEEELKIHETSKDILQSRHEKLEQLFQLWQHRIKQMQQEMEQQYNSVSCKRTVAMDKLMEKRSQFKEMEQVMVEEKEEQEKLRQQQAEARAATKLQAWWRGCMVRRGLGSFKKAEEDKKDKKKKKKEGKKKKK